MGRALGKMKQTLSVLLAVAMIVTALPQTAAVAYATEAQNVLDESSGAAENSEVNNDEGNVGNDGVNTGKENGSEETGTPDENGSEDINAPGAHESEGTQASDENGSENTGNPDENGAGDVEAPDENGSGNTENSDDPDGNGSQDIEDQGEADLEDAEEVTAAKQPVSLSDNSVSDNDVPDSSVSGNDTPEQEEDVIVKVRIRIPTYQYNSKYVRSFIKELQYKVDENEEWTRYRVKSIIRPYMDEDYVDVTAKAGSTVQFRIIPADRTVISEVSCDQYGGSYNVLKAENDIYKIENIQLGSWIPSYEVKISADFVYTLHFVDVYADDHDGNRSVKLYQYSTGNADSDTGEDTGDDGVTYKDVIGETVELSGAEMQKYFNNHYYKVEAEPGYTFHNIDSNTTGVRISKDSGGCLCDRQGKRYGSESEGNGKIRQEDA